MRNTTSTLKLFLTKLRMALLPSLQENLKRSNDNRTTLLRTREKETAHLSLGNEYLVSKGSRADEQCDKSNGLNQAAKGTVRLPDPSGPVSEAPMGRGR